ncbi:hypothetical protein [Hyphomicrobium sp. DMF-1]|uniref:hypothetical protein n=1 Tax=Hyphomicrobium sp. DMF-1 TaxID=3019544 RepID=UPI0022EBD028|nr:hypothetical protein [Hyphomicrobium sp. DMF-1]WBT37429.1 hypothetical protein PE058_17455 [Hyphomicrobium sp. DMF-1]
MRASFITASLMTALVLASSHVVGSRAASAADLYGDGYGSEPPYDERGYAEERDPGPYDDEDLPPPGRYSEAPPPDRYSAPYDRAPPIEPPRGSIKDGYPVPMPPPRYGDVRPGRYACLERWQIKRQLRRDGWVDLQPVGGDGREVGVRARRVDSGRVFMLRVDRCSGEILAARPHYLRTFAHRDRYWPERRWVQRGY